MSPLHVRHVNYARGWRGGEHQTLLLMRALREAGISNSLIARAGEPLAQRAAGEGFPVLESSAAGWATLRAAGVDLFHAHETRALQAAALTQPLHRVPLLVTRRVDYTPGGNPFTRWKYRRAARIVSVSHFVDRVMADWGAPEPQRAVIHDAAAEPVCGRDDERVAQIRGRFPGRTIIGCVAALVLHHKGQDVLIDAFHRARQQRGDIALILVGGGPDRDAIAAQIDRLGLKSDVALVGFQADPMPYFAAFDLFALSSREEGLGSVLLDAFAHRLPVLATDAGGIPELIEHEVTGWLSPREDAAHLAQGLRRLLDDTAFAGDCAKRAHERYRADHTPEIMAARYLALYRAVTGGGGR